MKEYQKSNEAEPNTENDTEESQVATQAIIEQLNEIPGISVQVVDDVDVPRGAERMSAGNVVDTRFNEYTLDRLPRIEVERGEWGVLRGIINRTILEDGPKKDVIYGAHTANNYYLYTQKEYSDIKVISVIPVESDKNHITRTIDETIGIQTFRTPRDVVGYLMENGLRQDSFNSSYAYAIRGQRSNAGFDGMGSVRKANGRTGNEYLGGRVSPFKEDKLWDNVKSLLKGTFPMCQKRIVFA